MPVIGRLDKQVEEILITPVGSGTRDAAHPCAPLRPAADETDTDDSARPADSDDVMRRVRDTGLSRDDAPLPVWLL